MIEQMKKEIKMRTIANNYITLPCFIVGCIALLAAYSKMWLVLVVFNFIVFLLNSFIISNLQNSIDLCEGSNKQTTQERKIKALYGEDNE